MIINEKEFINRMAEKGGVTKCSSKKYLYLVIETFLDLLKEGHVIRFYRLFKAELTTVVGKTSTDFANGGRIYVEPHKKIKMTWSKKLRNRINDDDEEEE